MKMTSAQAAKLLRQWNESLKALQRREENTKTFLASLGEDLESVRPEYDYAAMQAEQAAIEANIRKLKHTLNVFNKTTVIPEFEMTIDQMLIYLPQLTNRLEKLSRMKELLPKQRENALYNRNAAIPRQLPDFGSHLIKEIAVMRNGNHCTRETFQIVF